MVVGGQVLGTDGTDRGTGDTVTSAAPASV
jgi:hypothetical protein